MAYSVAPGRSPRNPHTHAIISPPVATASTGLERAKRLEVGRSNQPSELPGVAGFVGKPESEVQQPGVEPDLGHAHRRPHPGGSKDSGTRAGLSRGAHQDLRLLHVELSVKVERTASAVGTATTEPAKAHRASFPYPNLTTVRTLQTAGKTGSDAKIGRWKIPSKTT